MRDPGSSSYVATLKPVERFGSPVPIEARLWRSDHTSAVVILGDEWPLDLAPDSRAHRGPLPPREHGAWPWC